MPKEAKEQPLACMQVHAFIAGSGGHVTSFQLLQPVLRLMYQLACLGVASFCELGVAGIKFTDLQFDRYHREKARRHGDWRHSDSDAAVSAWGRGKAIHPDPDLTALGLDLET